MMDRPTYRRDEIQERLSLWATSQTKPKYIFPAGLDDRIDLREIAAANRIRELHAKNLSKKFVAENWYVFNYMNDLGIKYFLPTFLYLRMKSGMFPMADCTPIYDVVSGVSDAGGASDRTRRVYGLLSREQKRIVADYYLWDVRYRTEKFQGYKNFVSSSEFDIIFELTES